MSATSEAQFDAMSAEVGASLVHDDAPLADLVRSHETPNGLNEALRTFWFDDQNQARLVRALDRNLARVSGRH